MAGDTCAVLVVEDDRDLRAMLTEGLDLDGFEVQAAANGREALGILQSWRPHVILLDLNMPIMDGWTFRDAQRSQAAIANIPVIIFSASYQGKDHIGRLDAAAFLPKPCDIDHFIAVIGRVIEQKDRQVGSA